MSAFLFFRGPNAHNLLQQRLALMPSTAPIDSTYHSSDKSFAIALGGEGSGITESHSVVLAFEGYVTHTHLKGVALRQQLIDDFLSSGELCVKQYKGSFRIVIHHLGVTRVYTDQLACRALFYGEFEGHHCYSAHTAPLLGLVDKTSIDGANFLQFLQSGRFFSGSTLFEALKQFKPGVAHLIEADGALSQFTWYQYQLSNQSLPLDDVLPELKSRLDKAILDHWQSAQSPALLLSGGVDSRYILNTLAELLPPDELKRLHTCLWGELNCDVQSDGAWAHREAERHGVGYEFYLNRADARNLFDLMFATQSGMTAHVFSHTDDFYWCRHLFETGRRSLIRGDEIFGPNGDVLACRESALAKVGLSYISQDIEGLSVNVDDWMNAHRSHLSQLSELADEPNDLRDILYCRERLPALNAHLNSQRAPFVENFNPLLDMSIVDLVAQLPRELRTDKKIFRECFARYYPTSGFASSGNGFDWQRLWHQRPLATFVQEQLAQLPPPFDRVYWQRAGQLLDYSRGNKEQIALMQKAVRAIVLAKWIQD